MMTTKLLIAITSFKLYIDSYLLLFPKVDNNLSQIAYSQFMIIHYKKLLNKKSLKHFMYEVF